MAFRVKATSGRGWAGFEASIYEATAGYSEASSPAHAVSMQLGRPLLVNSRCGGASLRHLQVPGDLKLVPAHASRVWETESATVKLSMEVSQALLCSTADALNANHAGIVSIAPELHFNDARIEHIGWAVAAELESTDSLGRLYGESLGVALATQLVRRYAGRARVTTGTLSQRRVARTIEYIHANLASDLSLFDLSEIARLSPTHFKTLFKRATGLPVHQFVIRARVEQAAATLQRNGDSIADVALQVGFANQSHLARCMRRLLGVTPAQIVRSGRR